MEWENLLGELVQFVSSAAPELWTIALKQVTVEAVQYALFSIVLFAASVAMVIAARRLEKRAKEDRWSDADMGAVFLHILAPLVFIGAVGLLSSFIWRVINPEYYAIKLLVGYITGGQ